jgi:hypothetical protein
LLDPGKTGFNRTEWIGQHAWAIYTSGFSNG